MLLHRPNLSPGPPPSLILTASESPHLSQLLHLAHLSWHFQMIFPLSQPCLGFFMPLEPSVAPMGHSSNSFCRSQGSLSFSLHYISNHPSLCVFLLYAVGSNPLILRASAVLCSFEIHQSCTSFICTCVQDSSTLVAVQLSG